MKKIIALVCALLTLTLALAGCGAKKETVFIDSKADLGGKIIAVQEGTTGDIFASDIEGADIQRFKKAVDTGIELKNGKVDAVILDEQPAKMIVANNEDLMILEEDFAKEDYAAAVKKGNTELLDSINATLARIKEDGSYDLFIEAFIPEDGERDTLADREVTEFDETIVMGTNAEFEPFEFILSGGEIVGFDLEIANEIAMDMGKNLKVENMNFDSLINALASGKVDMVLAGLTVTEDRQKNADFSEPYYTSTQVIIIRKTSLEEK